MLYCLSHEGTSLVAQMVKCLPAMWETWVRSLGLEDPLEEEMAIHSSILAWRIPYRSLVGHGVTESDMTERQSMHTGTAANLLCLFCPTENKICHPDTPSV